PADLQDWLAAELSSVLRLPVRQLNSDVPLLRLGVDSLMAVALRNRLAQQFGITVALPDLLGGYTLNELAAKLTAEPPPIQASAAAAPADIEWVAGDL